MAKHISDHLRTFFTVKSIIIAVVIFCVSTAMIFTVFALSSSDFTVIDNGSGKTYKVFSKTVSEALSELKISVSSEDVLSVPANSLVTQNKTVSITRAKTIHLVFDGKLADMKTACKSVGEFLLSKAFDDTFVCSVKKEEAISEGMTIEVSKIASEEKVVEESIPYNVMRKPSYNLEKGVTRVKTKGQNGVNQVTYKTTFSKLGKITDEVVNTTVIKKAVDEVVEYGMIEAMTTARGGTIRSKKVLRMRATAYDLSYASCGKSPGDRNFGVTASGMKAQRGVVAVDPRVIPLGTRMYIEAADGSWSYGYCIAGDTGGAIKGNIVDLFYDSVSEVNRFGVKTVNVYILE